MLSLWLDPAIGVGGGRAATHSPYQQFGTPLDEIVTYIHESLPSLSCKYICYKQLNMRNSLFRLLILFDVFNELQLIY